MFISSTYWSDCLGLVAALTTIHELRRREVPAYLDRLGHELSMRLNAVAAETGMPVKCGGVPVHPHLQFQVDDEATKKNLSTLYIQEMAKRGCHGYASFYLNAAQGATEVEQTVAAAREAFALMRDGLDRGRLDDLLECDLTQDAFRRLVR
jgi:glutamate-1-semialdehyde aminotransferase